MLLRADASNTGGGHLGRVGLCRYSAADAGGRRVVRAKIFERFLPGRQGSVFRVELPPFNGG